jgi:peptidoglycan L-alanyl-D-glutamate endopeptidase CwlK
MLSSRDAQRLANVDKGLVALIQTLFERFPGQYFIIQGMRTIEEQRVNFAKGASKTMNSKHLIGRAVDVGVYKPGMLGKLVTWDWPHYALMAVRCKKIAKELGLVITWGGDWKFKDGPHIELGV